MYYSFDMGHASEADFAGGRRLRVAVVTSAPAPYRKGLFERLALMPDIEIKVYFLGKTCGVWNWDTEIGGEFPHEYLKLPRFIPEKRYSLWFHPQIPRILKDGNFDAVVIGGYFIPSFLLTIAWCRFNGTPYLLWSESHEGMRRSFLRRALRPIVVNPIIRGASAHLAVGSGAAEYLVDSGVERDRIFMLLNSPDVDRISEEVSTLRQDKEKWKTARGLGNGPVALFVGRLSPDKGIDDLLNAYKIVYSRKGNDEAPALVMVGRGELFSEVTGRVQKEGWAQVRVDGFVPPERITEYYAMADFFVLPSRHEPFGAVVHEAMSAGLPVVVSSAVGAAADLVRESVTGFITPVADPQSLAERMISLWENPQLCVKMGQECVKVSRMFDHNRGALEFVKAIRKAVGYQVVERDA